MNAKKQVLKEKEALGLAAQASDIFAAKGKKVVHLNLKKEKPTKDELLKLMLGPTGNLRAPTLKAGKKLVIGFNEEMYQKLFG